jgi:hypothetical protein
VESSGDIIMALLDSSGYQRWPDTPRPLFLGLVENRLSFSVSIPVTGDHYVVFDNRSGRQPRAVTATVFATRGGADQLETADKILRRFEQQLHQIFVFDPFRIGVEKCATPKAFVDTSGIVLCVEYVQILYDTIGDRQKAKDALSFSIFHEVGRVLLTKWNYPSRANQEAADEFATVLMVMIKKKEQAMATAEYFINNPSVSEAIMKLFRDDRHPLSVQRSRNILRWLKDPQFARRWQRVLVPHMQTALLKRLRQQPTAWADRPLVEKELAARKNIRTGI